MGSLGLHSSANRSANRLKLFIAIAVVLLVLLFPGHPNQFTWNALGRLPLELPIIILVLLLVPVVLKKMLCVLLASLALLLMLLRLADIGSYLAFNRRFSPLLELHLLSDGWNLVSTSTSPLQALVIVAIALFVLVLIVWFFYRCLLRIANTSHSTRSYLLIAASLATVVITAGLFAEQRFDYEGPVQAEIVPEFNKRVTSFNRSITDQKKFVVELREDAVLDQRQPGFNALENKDIIFIFVESYGRGYIEAERFSTQAKERLTHVQSTLDAAGMQSKSGWLTSPIRGGRSWLAHASLQAGLKVDNQARFDRLVTGDRPSFTKLFESAGWKTVGIMPAIQFAWPEGAWYDFQSLHVAEDMQYRGDRFGYVTMPDQYTMSHFQHAVREPSESPIMATIALLSTHAPWTPIPNKLDWNSIGDGSIYDGSQRYGEKISWKYRSKVQDMFTQSLDYTMDILGEYAAQYGDNAVIVIMGDHQPPPIINGWGNSGDVPVHIISNDSSFMQRLPKAYWQDGMLPSTAVNSQPMWGVREWFSTMFE